MFADIRDTRIYFDVDGMGLVPEGPTMVERKTAFLVHGGPGVDHSSYKVGSKDLAARLQLVFFDHRGQGRSARGDPRLYTLDENVEDMEALRRHLGLGPIVSIGASYGGMVAMAHAARYPDAVSHLVLVATASHGGLLDRAVEIVRERGTTAQIEMIDRMLLGEIADEAQVLDFFRVMGPLYARRFDLAGFERNAQRTIYAPDVGRAAFGPGGMMRTFDLRPELRNITAPTLLIAGRHDFICAPEFAEEMHKLIPGSTLRIFEDSSHLISADEPQNYIDAVLGFLVHNVGRAK